MKKMKKTKIDAKKWEKLGYIAEIITSQIWKKRNSIFSNDYRLNIDEIKSEAYYKLSYLIQQYDDSKGVPIENYCFKYLEKLVINELKKEEKSIKRYNFDLKYYKKYDLDGDKRYDNILNICLDYFQAHQIIEADISQSNISLENHIEQQDLIKSILNKSNKLDKAIMLRIYAGESYDDIANDIGISKGEISKRMKKYSK